MIKIVDGDILKATEDIICHQTNCVAKMNAGLAKQIREKYPHVYYAYKQLCKEAKSNELLGSVQLIGCDDGKIIANLFGQEYYGRHGQFTNYIALRKALHSVCERAKNHKESVAIPYNIGCGLAGGEWSIVYQMIQDIFYDYDVILYRWEK